MKKHQPIHNLGKWAHPPKTNVNFAKPMKAQTRNNEPKIIGPSGDRGKKAAHPGFTNSGKKVMK